MIGIAEGFREEMARTLGKERAARLVTALDFKPEVSVRLNPRKINRETADAASCEAGAEFLAPLFAEGEMVPWCGLGRYLPERPQFALMPEWHAGAFYVQDASSMFIGFVIKQLRDKYGLDDVRLLDLCAAPGGKTTAALDELTEGTVVVANELIGSRAAILKENLLKWGRKDVIVTSADSAKFAKAGELFDIVIADVPCSGEGMMRKDEEARRQWSEGLVAQCASLQREIAGNAVDALMPGGFLIYSTCTFNTSEDEENVAYLIEEHGLESIEIEFNEGWGIGREVNVGEPLQQSPGDAGNPHCLRFIPGEVRGEGLFMAVLRKPESTAATRRAGKPEKPSKVAPKGWLRPGLDLKIYDNSGHLYALTDEAAGLLARLQQAKIGILSAGVQVAEVKGKDFIPQPGLAWSDTLADGEFPEVEVDKETALQYLRREAVILPAETPKGYVIVAFNGVRLGFVKNLGNRSNNLYPQEYRLRIKS